MRLASYRRGQGSVPAMIDDAAQAKIETYSLRRGISVLEGSGGNIAVLTGKDGKLLIDSIYGIESTNCGGSQQPECGPYNATYQYPLACGSHGWKCLGIFSRRYNHSTRKHN